MKFYSNLKHFREVIPLAIDSTSAESLDLSEAINLLESIADWMSRLDVWLVTLQW